MVRFATHPGQASYNILLNRPLDSTLLSSNQIQMDQALGHFSQEAGHVQTMLAMATGGAVFRLFRTSSLAITGSSRLLQGLSYVGALAAETSAFRAVNAGFGSFSGRPGEGVFNSQAWWSTFTDLGTLKAFAFLGDGQNPFLSHTLQTGGLVAGRHLNAALGLAPRPRESLTEQFVQAEIMNLEMSAGYALFGLATGFRLHALERSLDLYASSFRETPFFSSPFQPLAATPEGMWRADLISGEGNAPEWEKNIHLMSSEDGGKGQANKAAPAELGEHMQTLAQLASGLQPRSPQDALRVIQEVLTLWLQSEVFAAHETLAAGQRPQAELFSFLGDRHFLNLLPEATRTRLEMALDQLGSIVFPTSPPPHPLQEAHDWLYFTDGSADANVEIARRLLEASLRILQQKETDRPITTHELLQQIAGLAIFFRQAFDRTQRENDRDLLTGALNRRALDRLGPKLEASLLRRERERQAGPDEYWVLMIDGDHFKKVNDTYGHPNGDRALQHYARIFQESVREMNGDYVIRYGGEEFLIILKNPGIGGLRRVTQDIKTKLAAQAVQYHLSEAQRAAGLADHAHLTVSIGAAPLRPMPEASEGALAHAIQRADAAVYEAKARGRNQLMIVGKTEGQFIDEAMLEAMLASLP